MTGTTDLQPAIDRFRAIAAASGDALLTEGPVHPDHALLDLSAEALHLLKTARALGEERGTLLNRVGGMTGAHRAQFDAVFIEERALMDKAKHLLIAAGKVRATTAAGIYAKALMVRMSTTAAPKLALSLAQELIDCPGLRAMLWPAEAVASHSIST